MNPSRAVFQTTRSFLVVKELAGYDDAIRVVDHNVASPGSCDVGLHAQEHIVVGELDFDVVGLADPAGCGQAGFLGDLARQALDDALALVNDPARGAPVQRTVASAVLDEQKPVGSSDDPSGNEPVTHPIQYGVAQRQTDRSRLLGCGRTCARAPYHRSMDDFVDDDERKPAAADGSNDGAHDEAGTDEGQAELTAAAQSAAVERRRETAVARAMADSLPATRLRAAAPPPAVRGLAVGSIIIGGICGGLIGFAFTDLQCTDGCTGWAGASGVLGALIGAIGVAVVAILVLRAMDEWETVRDRTPEDHPARKRPS